MQNLSDIQNDDSHPLRPISEKPFSFIEVPVFDKWRAAKRNRPLSERRFEAIARSEARIFNRIEVLTVNGYVVSATVRTNTGYGTWRFTVDFDQEGGVNGVYSIWSENDDSIIPREMAMGMSNAIKALLSESNDAPDRVTSETPLALAIEIEMVRQEGASIREAASKEAKEMLSEAQREAEEIRSAARRFYDYSVSSAHKEAEAIHSQAIAEAEEIKLDAEHIAEEQREARARRRAFVSKHKKLLACIVLCFVFALGLAITTVRQNAHAALEAKLIPVGIDSSECIGAQYKDIETQLLVSGFTNISCIAMADLDANNLEQEETIRFVTIDGKANFYSADQFPYDSEIEVYYLTALQINPPLSSRDAQGKDVDTIKKAFANAGFANVKTKVVKDLILGISDKPDTVASVSINGNDNYSCKDELRPDVEIVIYYHDYKWAS